MLPLFLQHQQQQPTNQLLLMTKGEDDDDDDEATTSCSKRGLRQKFSFSKTVETLGSLQEEEATMKRRSLEEKEATTRSQKYYHSNERRPQSSRQLLASPTPASHHLLHNKPTQAHLSMGRRPLPLHLLLLLLLPALVSCQQNGSTEESSTTTTPAATSGGDSFSPESSSFEASQANNQNVTKLKPVNFTQVDEIFEAVLSDDEVVKRWKFMDSQIQDGMKSILKMLFPQIVSLSQDAKVSGDCSGGILKWILSLRNLRSWAIKMLDATGKPTAGIFEGSLTMFGNYRQCLSIRAPDEDEIEITEQFEEYFRGQYCVLHLKPWMPVKQPFYHLNSTIEPLLRKNYKYYEKTFYDELAEIAIAFNFVDIRMDLCVPSTCTMADIQRVADLLSKKLEMRAKVMRCDIASRETNPLNNLDRHSFYWLALPIALMLTSLVATVLMALKCGATNEEPQVAATADKRQVVKRRESQLTTVLQCLSFGGAIRDRLSMPPGNLPTTLQAKFGFEDQADSSEVAEPQVSLNLQRKPLPLYGLRNVFIFWFLVVQMTVELKYQYLRESLQLRNMIISYWPFQIIVNSSLLFESLILITSFTFSYTCLESTLKDLIGYVVDKYIRLILSIITLIALTIVTPLINIESPVWRNFVEQQSNVCKSTGYLDLFFLQNFISYDKICLPHTWLFCVELQLIVLSIPIILLLKKTFMSTEDSVIIDRTHPMIGDATGKQVDQPCLTKISFCRLFHSKAGALSLLLMVAGLLINFLSVYWNQLPASWFYTFPDVEQKNYYFSTYLTKTWTHLSAFIIGLLGGHICRSSLQLRNVRLLKKHQLPAAQQQQQQRSEGQPSPAPSNSTGRTQLDSRASSQSRSGSTSTIMAMEQEVNGGQTSNHEQDVVERQQRQARRRRTLATISSQAAAACCMAAIIFSTFTWSTQVAPEPLVAALYDAGTRLLWSLALVGLMIQLCLPDEQSGRYSAGARLLSHPICTLIGRLSFLAYLISPYVHTFVLAVEEQSLFPSLFLIFHLIVGNIVITYIFAFILAIVIEQPLRRLISRFVLGKRFRKQKINISTYYETTEAQHARTIPTIATQQPAKAS